MPALSEAARDWRTLLATGMSDQLTLWEAVDGPRGEPVGFSGAESTARIWSYDAGVWGVSQTVDLVDQLILDASYTDPLLRSTEPVIVDGSLNETRFVFETAYGFDGEAWVLLPFVGPDAGQGYYAMDAVIINEQVVVHYNNCSQEAARRRPQYHSASPVQ